MNRIVVVGSINIDITCYLDTSPIVGETLVARDVSVNLGGKGANQAVAASRLGMSTGMIGAVGDDPFGQNVKKSLEASGVSRHILVLPGQSTGLAIIDVMADGSNTIRLGAGANVCVTPQLLEDYRAIIDASDVLLLQNEIPLETSLAAASMARDSGTLVIMDPAPAPREPWPADVLRCFDLITPNAHEVEIITGYKPVTLADAEIAAAEIQAAGARGAIVTMGDAGVAWNFGDSHGQRISTPVLAIDTVAAGDCFNAALGVALADRREPEQAIKFACDVGALATTKKGASASAPYRQEVDIFQARKA